MSPARCSLPRSPPKLCVFPLRFSCARLLTLRADPRSAERVFLAHRHVCEHEAFSAAAPRRISVDALRSAQGIALGYWSNYGTILHISDDSHWQWRIPLLVQFVPGVIVCAFIFFVPESPRWLAWKGHEAKALRALVRLRRLPEDHPFVVQEYTDILGGIEAERGNSQSWVGLGKELVKDRTLARRFILVLIAQVGYNFSGGNSITCVPRPSRVLVPTHLCADSPLCFVSYYQTTILTQVGIKGDDAYLFSVSAHRVVPGLGCVSATPLTSANCFRRASTASSRSSPSCSTRSTLPSTVRYASEPQRTIRAHSLVVAQSAAVMPSSSAVPSTSSA